MSNQPAQKQPTEIEVDVLIIGAGPAGLSAACKLMQLAKKKHHELNVVVLEKGSEVGSHILSGAIFEPKALNELFPDWKKNNAPLNTKVQEEQFFMFKNSDTSIELPLWMIPKSMHNQGNYVVSLGKFCRWLGKQAESLGVQIFSGFPASKVLFNENGNIKGVSTGEMGRNRDGQKKSSYEMGINVNAKVTLFAEGCRGHLGKQLIDKFNLNQGKETQHYGIGIKELWKIDKKKWNPGLVIHGAGWPLSEHGASGGSFLYHLENNLVSIGLITDLSYKNPYISPFDELQRFKHHPKIKKYLDGAQRISYGARAITKGGLNSLPKMCLPNALLIGCNAGTLNFSKIKGSHTAMKSGMLAAETAFTVITGKGNIEDYEKKFNESWLYKELYQSRNFGGALHHFGHWVGGMYNLIDQNIFGGKLPFKFSNPIPDHSALKPALKFKPIIYPKSDEKLSFDKLSSVYLSNTNHEVDQPIHLKLNEFERALKVNFSIYSGPEQRFCPAGVYEFYSMDSKISFRINAQNCVHCKTCDIKDPTQNINWISPEGGGGPNYSNM